MTIELTTGLGVAVLISCIAIFAATVIDVIANFKAEEVLGDFSDEVDELKAEMEKKDKLIENQFSIIKYEINHELKGSRRANRELENDYIIEIFEDMFGEDDVKWKG